MVIPPKSARVLRRSLLRWYRRNGRDLPWRQTRDPYAVLVSEFMLQQTQVATVTRYYNRWLGRFPNFAALAEASESDVLHAWQGLGYYARARNLHATAKAVQDRHHGRFPHEIDEIGQFPGAGRYTARAVATFAFDRAVPIVETNIARVLARILDLREPIDSNVGREALWEVAAGLVPKRAPRAYNSALIDLGALICLPRHPKCHACPLKKVCRAKNPELLPIRKARPRTRQLTETHAFVSRKNEILLEQSTGRWRAMWMLPRRRSTSGRPIHTSIFPFTHHRITLAVHRQRGLGRNAANRRWFPLCRLNSIPIPSPHRRAIQEIIAAKSHRV